MNNQPQSRRRFLQTSLGAAALLGVGPQLLAACGDDDDATTGTTAGSTTSTSAGTGTTASSAAPTTVPEVLRLSVMEPFPLVLNFIAEVAAVSGGFAAAEHLDLDLQFAQSAPQALQQLAAGSVVVAGNGPLALVRAVAQEGAPFRAFGTTVQETLYRLVSTEEHPFEDIADLPGKTVGFPTLGGNAEDVFNLLVRAAGGDPGSVTRVAVGNDAAALAFVDDGRVDLIFATLEAATGMRLAGLSPKIVEFEGSNPLLGTALIATEESLVTHREALVRYLRMLRASMEAVADPAQLPDLIGKVKADWNMPQLDDEARATAIIQVVSQPWFAAGEDEVLRCVPERWAEGVEGFTRLGLAPAGSDPTTFYTNDLYDEAFG